MQSGEVSARRARSGTPHFFRKLTAVVGDPLLRDLRSEGTESIWAD